MTSEPEKKQANRGRGDKNAAVTERAEADAKRAYPASVLTLTTEVASPGESRAGRGRYYDGGGRSAGLSRAPAGGRRHRRQAAGGSYGDAASYGWPTMGRRAEESQERFPFVRRGLAVIAGEGRSREQWVRDCKRGQTDEPK